MLHLACLHSNWWVLHVRTVARQAHITLDAVLAYLTPHVPVDLCEQAAHKAQREEHLRDLASLTGECEVLRAQMAALLQVHSHS